MGAPARAPGGAALKHTLARLALLVAASYLVWLMALLALQRSMLFPRHWIPDPPAGAAAIDGLERLWVEHAEGRTEAWFLPGKGVSAAKPGPLVIYAHGNGELIDFAAPLVLPYRAMGVSVALLEYRGYGRSDGEPSEEAIVEDFLAFDTLLRARPDVDQARIVHHGRSLGGGAIVQLSLRRPPVALILESTFRSVPAMARRYLAPSFLIRDKFDTEAALPKLKMPMLLMHGTRDGVVSYAHGRRLAELAPHAKAISFDCGHNDLPWEAKVYWDPIRGLLGPVLDTPVGD